MDLAEDMYKEELLEHYQHPSNYGKINKPSAHYTDYNPVCGDEVEISMNIKNRKIENIKFQGKGCAISQAAASILTEHLKGKSSDAISMSNDRMLKLLPIEVSYLRIKCGLLALKATQKAFLIYRGKNG